MNHYRMPLLLRRWLAGVLAVLIGVGPLAEPAFAALIPLGDQPLNIQNSAQPNLVLTVDDSTSMLFDFLPDYVVSNYCRGGVGSMTAACGNLGATNDFTAVGGGKYFSPGYTSQQYNYPYRFTGTGGGVYDIGGPAAGCNPGAPPTCSIGVNPGPLPGLNVYPAGPQPSWPYAGRPYEYWELWPAPPHSAAFNAIYYDPKVTYDPPVDATGASFPQMDAAFTGAWTSVQADPWASSITYVDLTAPVTVGQWCDSDWSLGLVTTDPTDPNFGKYCRVNGSGASAFGTVSAAQGADYTYPWAPTGFTVSASPGSTTANTYAAQKVTLDGTLTGTAITANWNATTKDSKFFYENENVIWCDPTSPSWPQIPSQLNQTCTGTVHQTCSAQQQQCCKDPGTCGGNPIQASCGNLKAGTCQNAGCTGGTAGTCNGFSAGACVFGTCGNKNTYTCNGNHQTCNNATTQTCSGSQTQTCQLPGTQTCQPPVCSITYSPVGCNLLPPDPENPCTPITTCAPPVCTPNPGTCSITHTSCTSDTQCGPVPGVCSISGRSCTVDTDCGTVGHCSIDNTLCDPNNPACLILGGHCSNNNANCTKNSDCSFGTCSNKPSTFCLLDTDCGLCNNGGAVCTANAQCPTNMGTCNQKLCSDGVTPCTTNAQCGAGTCNQVSCSSSAQCPLTGGAKCANGGVNAGKACTVNSQCPGTCNNKSGTQTGKNCFDDSGCIQAGTCNLASQNCTSACTNVNYSGTTDTSCGCPVQFGTCKGSKVTPPPQCSATSCNQGQTNFCCSNILTCQLDHSTCTASQTCPNTQGVCSLGISSDGTGKCDCASVTVDCSNKVTSISATCAGGKTVDQECPPVGHCSIQTTVQCTSDGQCPSQPGPLPPSAATCSTGNVGGVAAATLRHDAETVGVVCRRNNQTSATAAYASGAYDYPSGKFLTPISFGTGADACPATDHYAVVPRHYWKSSVEWCDHKIATPGDQWLGYGTDTVVAGSTCQPGKDSTHIYPRFFQFGQLNYVDNKATAAFERVVLDITKRGSATYTHNWTEPLHGPNGQVIGGKPMTITRSFDQEMTNYANWFAYYRTRVQAVKTVTSLSFSPLDKTYRVGFHTLSNGLTTAAGQSDPATFVNIKNFDAGQKTAWYAQLFAISIPLGLETPTLDAMARIGEYFLNGSNGQLAGSTDPIILSCQKNWHMLFTDGFTNQAKPTTLVGDNDLTLPKAVDPLLLPVGTVASDLPTGRAPGEPRTPVKSLDPPAAGGTNTNWDCLGLGSACWPHPFIEDTGGRASDAASDYAMHYWETDLRNANKGNSDNNVPATAKDPATWQHLNFAALSLGTQGKLPIDNQSLTESQIASGALNWPQPIPTTWHPDNSGVDDLWHAATNGRGRFVNAQTAAELKNGIGQILEDITNQAGARSGAGFISGSISAQNHAVYLVTFQPGWAGTLTKEEIDTTTGAVLSTDWEAATQLSNQLTVTIADPTPWFTKRNIFTVKDDGSGGPGSAVPFLWANLSAAQQDSLAPGQPAVGQAILAFLRGDASNEGIGIGQFRVRGTGPNGSEDFLGDIVDSQAVYVGVPNFPYLDTNDPGYSGFVSSMATRPPRVYVGANDGMAHAFDDANGNEVWAFVPHDLYRPDNTGLGALSYQNGGLPAFKHHFYVDSTPRTYDVNFGGGASDWHTLMVGGLGKGGKSYYAIDVTNPTLVTDETSAAAQYLWTFTDADMGYTYGRPILTKTHATQGAFTAGQWVAIVSAGYNNPTGLGKIFFIDAKTGAKLKEMDTGFGNPASPSGLVHIVGYTKDFHNQLVEQIYAGDLYGNFWRFDVSDSDPGNWLVTKFAYLTDPTGAAQPVTTAPTVDVDIVNGVDRWVFVGTGRLLDQTDLTDASIADQQQTLYAFRDGTSTTPSLAAVTLQPRTDLVPLVDKVNGLSGKPPKGWYDDLPAGQRIVSPVKAALSLVAYAGTSAQDNPCLTGEPATLYVRSFGTGESLVTDSGGVRIAGVDEPAGAVGLDVTVFTESGTGTAAGPDIRIAVTTAAGTIIFQQTITQAGLANSRMSWRLFGQ